MKSIHKTLVRLGSTLLLALSTALTARADYASTVISQNPVGYYQLNETVQPTSSSATNSGSLGSSANGTYVSLPSLNQPGPFTGSVSVGLDGTSQYVSVPWLAGLNTPAFSFEIWANPAQVPKFDYLASSVEVTSPRSGWYFAQDDGSTFGLGSAWVIRFFNQNASTPSVTLSAPVVTTAGTWVLLTLTYNGTTAVLYTNGVAADTETPTGYVPNVDAPFTIGARSSLNFEWPGKIAETAMYGTALTAGRVAAHYTAAKTAPATYATTVLADAPLTYYRFQAPSQPIAANSGTLGSAGNGLYLADAVAGTPGPTPPPYPGFSAANKAPAFDAGSGAVRLPAFNFNTNTVTITCWVNATNLPTAENAGAGIVVCDGGSTASGLIIDGVNGGLGLGYFWNNDPNTYEVSLSGDLGLPMLNNAEWDYVALVIQPTEADIYISSPTIPFTSVTNFYPNVNQAFDAATLIGIDGGAVPPDPFNGAIDEVAIWDRSLASGELYSQYASAVGGLGPIVFSGPPSPDQPIVAGDTLTLVVNAGGTPNLFYQWYSNSVAISGANSSVYTKPNFSIAADSGTYFVIVTNSFGSATSGVATVTGQLATAPVITSVPVGGNIYPGGTLNLSVGAKGGGLVFQWSTNGTPIPGATKSSYIVASVSTNDAGSYYVSVTNSLGATNLGPFVITVPVLAPGTYAQVVSADAPEAWWRMDDISATNGALMADAMGRHPGTYTNAGGLTVGNIGAITGGIAGTAAEFTGDASYGYVPFFPALADQKFTLEMWVNQTNIVNNVTAASSADANGNNYGVAAESYWQGFVNGGTFGQPPGVTAGYDPTILPGQWTHIVITHDPTLEPTYAWEIWVNGVTDGYIWEDGPVNQSGPFIIGGLGTGLPSILSDNFIGDVDEVAFYGNKILTSTQIQAHYAAAFFGVPPSFSVLPQSQTAFAGENVTLSAAAVGAQPIAYQWKKNNANLPFQTNMTLIVSNVSFTANTDIYSVTATNAFGITNSSGTQITVYYPPNDANLTNNLVCHLTFDGTYSDSSGHNNNGTPIGSPSFVPGILGGQGLNVSTDTTNGIYNYVTLGNPPDFQFGSLVNFSISYWVQFPTNAAPEDLPFFCSAINSTGGPGITLSPSGSGGWQWSLDNLSTNGVRVAGAQNTINDGSWHNVVETFDRTENGSTYLDGQLVSAVSIVGIGSIDSGSVFNIGQDPTGLYPVSATYNLDDMGVWREVLSDIEAKSIYYVAQHYGKSFNTSGPANLSCNIYKTPSGNVGISWQTGTLVSSGTVTGPWNPVPGATLPFYQTTPAKTNTFYRVQP